MNTIIRFGGENEILPKYSSLRFYESELKPFDVDLSFPIEDLPFKLNQDFKADGTPFENYLFLKIDRENKQLIPLPDYKPKRIAKKVVMVATKCIYTVSDKFDEIGEFAEGLLEDIRMALSEKVQLVILIIEVAETIRAPPCPLVKLLEDALVAITDT